MNPPPPPPQPSRGAVPVLHGWPAVVVHGLGDARHALSRHRPLTLLSSPGAALFAGTGWWRALVEAARHEHPLARCDDILDCADAPGRVLEALRHGQRALVLAVGPAYATLHALAADEAAVLLPARPPALDLADPRALYRLDAWLADDAWLAAGA